MHSAEIPGPVAEKVSQPKRSVRPLAGLGVAGVFVAIGAFFVLHNLNSPGIGIVTVPVSRASAKANPGPLVIHGKTVTFQYPDSLQRVPADSLASNDIEKFLFTNPQHPAWSLAIQIKKLPSGILADDSSYNLRKQNPQDYLAQTLTLNGNRVSTMTSRGSSYSKVAFLTSNGLVAEIALSGSDSNDSQSQQMVTVVLASWHWL